MPENIRPREQCDHDEIEMNLGRGRVSAYRDMEGLAIPDDLALPTCTTCGEWFVNRSVAPALDTALALAYTDTCTRQARAALVRLSDMGFTLTRLEQLLGVSGGYLSRIKNRRGDPSMALTLQLVQWAMDPSRVEEASRLKRTGVEPRMERQWGVRFTQTIALMNNATTARDAGSDSSKTGAAITVVGTIDSTSPVKHTDWSTMGPAI